MKRFSIALAICLSLVLCASAALAGQTRVKVAFCTWVGYAPLYIAKEKGMFDKYGLDVDIMIIEDESQYAAAMATGSIDALGNVLDREIIHYAKGTAETLLFAMDESSGGDGLIASGDIRTVADLRGRTVGLDKSASSYFFFLSLLEKNNIPESEINVLEMSTSDAGAAFMAGRLDAAVTWEPWLSKAIEREGGHILVSSADYPRTIVDVFMMRNEFIKEHPEAPLAMTRAWFEAIDWYRANPDEGNAIMAKGLGESRDDVADMVGGVTFYGRKGNLSFMDKSAPNSIFEVAERAGSFWRAKGIIAKDADVTPMISDAYVKEAAK